MPILSVITVVKDDATGLRRTLESVHNQNLPGHNYRSWEVVVVDGSAPELREVALGAGLENMRFFCQAPAGIYSAMNFAVTEALGDYLLFVNAGDTLVNTSILGTLIDVLERESPGWAFGRVHFTSESGRQLSEPQWNYDTEADHLFARGLFPSHQGTVVRRDLVSKLGGFDQNFAIASDYHLMLRVHQNSRPLVLDFAVADFQQGGASTVKWRKAIGEFHRARVEVFQPSGFVRVREWSDTAVQYMKTGLGHAVKGFRRG